MNRIISLIILLAFVMPKPLFAVDKAPKTPNAVIAEVKAKGPQRAIVELFESGDWQKYVYPGIRSGDSRWLKVAVALEPGADAGGSEELGDALFWGRGRAKVTCRNETIKTEFVPAFYP